MTLRRRARLVAIFSLFLVIFEVAAPGVAVASAFGYGSDLQNHAVGMLVAGSGAVSYLIPITQVLADSSKSFPASTAVTVVKAQQIAQAQARPTEDRAALLRAFKATEAIVDKNRAHLMKVPHVDDVSACGTPEKEWAICVQVENHKYLSEVESKIPSQIEGLPVRIEPLDQGWSL